MEKNQFYIGIIQSSVFVPEQEWRLSQERNLFTLFFFEDKEYNQRRFFATKIRAVETISSRTMNSSPHWLDSCVLSPLVQQPVILCQEVFANRQKGHDMELYGDHQVRDTWGSMRIYVSSTVNKTPFVKKNCCLCIYNYRTMLFCEACRKVNKLY